ncbi:MAG: BON domain-containing protein [Gammaproteobacteria bacterium]|nr:MAG: BON domain-containing protein [Gammaproteobacteria bacterium]
MKLAKAIIVALILSNSVYGCVPLVVGGAAATGGAVAYSRRSAGTFIDDESIELKTRLAILEEQDLNSQIHINIISYNGIVLMVGQAPTEELRTRAENIVSRTPKVRMVHNEMSIAAPSAFMTRSSDTVITGKVKTSILGVTGDNDNDGLRTKVVTENGVVYLMGLLSHAEADAVTNAARKVGGVQKVVKLFEYTD